MIGPDPIDVRGARVHNLKGIDVSIPLGKVVGICGVSGSGKSSLAMGILYSEGSRRYLESLSTYTRRRISQAAPAVVDDIENVPAALALHQRPSVPGIRSTFGTMTELLNILRLMYSRLGSHPCPNGHMLPPTMDVALDRPLVCPECGEFFQAPGAESFAFNSDGACPRCEGTGSVREVDEKKLVPDDSKTLMEGAVESWNIFGIQWMYRVAGELGVRIDIPFKDLSPEEKEIVYHGEETSRMVMIPSSNGKLFELKCTYRNAHQSVVEALKGAETEKGLERVNRYLRTMTCPECGGTRLCARARSSTLLGLSLPEAVSKPLSEMTGWVSSIPEYMPDGMESMANLVVEQFLSASGRLLDLGLGYLSLDRPGSTLSTGELQRVQMAKAVRNRTTGVLYVLDEPSIGLHPANMDGLVAIMRDLVGRGNTVVFVDHDTRILRSADWLIEIGPGSGSEGGELVAEGTVEDICSQDGSLIRGFIDGSTDTVVRCRAGMEDMFSKGTISMHAGPLHTVKDLTLEIPINRLTVVTGVSGSGKTTTVLEGLVPALSSQDRDVMPSHILSLDPSGIDKVCLIDATPIGANIRSTVATYSEVMDDLRKVFSKEQSSDGRRFRAGDFSYNTGSLRCRECDGTGRISLDVQFLPDVDIVCPACNGSRYGPDAYTVRRGCANGDWNLPDLMAMTVDNAIEALGDLKRIRNRLQTLSDLGLGYLTLGESTTALSGGEAQRLKLAAEMGRPQEGTMFVFDEPTIGLHPLDVRSLISVMEGLLDTGATVVVIEHDLDFIRNADYIIDMGPGGGEQGGRIVSSGTPDMIASDPDSVTGHYL